MKRVKVQLILLIYKKDFICIFSGQEDEFETDIPTSTTPPRSTRTSIAR